MSDTQLEERPVVEARSPRCVERHHLECIDPSCGCVCHEVTEVAE